MRSKFLLLAAIIIVSGAMLTLGSVVIAQKSPLPESCLGRLHQADRGFPLHFLTLKPSVSLCESVDQLSVVWKGNAYHEESIATAAVDFVFWSGLSAAGLLGFKRYRQLR